MSSTSTPDRASVCEDRRGHAGPVLAGQGDQQGPRWRRGRRRWSSRVRGYRCCRWRRPSVRAMTDITPHDQLHRARPSTTSRSRATSTRGRSAGSSTTTAPTTPASAPRAARARSAGSTRRSTPTRGGPLVLIRSEDLDASLAAVDGGRRRDRGRPSTPIPAAGASPSPTRAATSSASSRTTESPVSRAARPRASRRPPGPRRAAWSSGRSAARRVSTSYADTVAAVVEQREVDDRGGPQRPGRQRPGAAAGIPGGGAASVRRGAGPSARRRPRAANGRRRGRPARPRSW